MTKPTDPITSEEMEAASDRFFPLFQIVLGRMPEGSSTEDALKVMESVVGLAHKMRKEKKEEEDSIKFGFNKIEA